MVLSVPMSEQLITRPEAARRLGLTSYMVSRLAAAGVLRMVQVGRRWWVSTATVEALEAQGDAQVNS